MLDRRLAEWIVAMLFAAVVGLVFQQISTDMTAQGIASGGPYNDAASYPRALAVVILIVLAANVGIRVLRSRSGAPQSGGISAHALRRPAALLSLFALYLIALGMVGYLVASVAVMVLTLLLCGERSPLRLALVSVGVTFGLSIVFGGLLDVVLPRGHFGIALPW